MLEPRQSLTHEELNRLKSEGIEYPPEAIEAMAQADPQGPWLSILAALDAGASRGFVGHVVDDGNQIVILWEAQLPDEDQAKEG
jgi:hypothetical protein